LRFKKKSPKVDPAEKATAQVEPKVVAPNEPNRYEWTLLSSCEVPRVMIWQLVDSRTGEKVCQATGSSGDALTSFYVPVASGGFPQEYVLRQPATLDAIRGMLTSGKPMDAQVATPTRPAG